MSKTKRFFRVLPLLIALTVLSVLIWSWVFTRITDTDAAHKVTVFVDAAVPRARELAVALEEAKPEGIRMVQVRPFRYAMMDSSAIENADLYILRASDIETYWDWLAPLPTDFPYLETALLLEEEVSGIPVYLPEACLSIAGSCIDYVPPGEPEEAYYLFFGRSSLHVLGNENALDDAAVPIAKKLLELR